MELKDFVSTTLKEIYSGLNEAKTSTRSFQIWSTGYKEGGIHFDLAVTSASMTENASNKGGGLKIKVASVDAGKQGKSTESAETTSRIVFTVNPTDG